MSIQTEITRLQQAKDDLIAEITAKGVTAPSDASLDDLAALVKSIQTGVNTSDATATAADIVSGKTAYVNGSKVTGTLVLQTYYYGSSEPSADLGIDGDLYFVIAGD